MATKRNGHCGPTHACLCLVIAAALAAPVVRGAEPAPAKRQAAETAAPVPASPVPAAAAKPDPALKKAVPETVADLIAIEKRVKELVGQISSSTVAVRIGRAQGSGVIVSKDGYVLTAAHVAGAPKQKVLLTLSDGRTVNGLTLGLDRSVDAGMIKITDEGEWPAAEMAAEDSYAAGHWCIAVGHPNGYQKDRGSVLRLGRVLAARRTVVQTDCTLVGGDSGGPLFDLEGRVIGIHSRIGVSTAWNFHVPVSAYRGQWDQLVKGEEIGGQPERGTAILGVNGDDASNGCKVTKVSEGFPAEQAGLKVDDVITKFDGAKVDSFRGLQQLVLRKQPGDEVAIEVLRNGRTESLKAVLGRRE